MRSLLMAGAVGMASLVLPDQVRAQDFAAIVAAGDRSDADRQTDQRRKPAQLLAFMGVKTGMKVLDMGAGGGYSTELLARSVGPAGKVVAQNSAPSERAKAAFEARAKSPAMANVTSVDRPFDDPAPAGEGNFDLIAFLFFYHDTTYMTVDRAVMNAKLFAALKPGGVLVVADHSARTGEGATVGKSMHRIEESVVRAELETAGFKQVASGDFLRNAQDPRDKPVFRPEQPVDEFVLRFERPR